MYVWGHFHLKKNLAQQNPVTFTEQSVKVLVVKKVLI